MKSTASQANPRALPGAARRPFRRGRSGFTLVEVVLALGMVTTALVPMVGLLAVGLGTFHDAINATTEAQILQQIAGQIEVGSFSAAANQATTHYYFTPEGVSTDASSAFYYADVPPPGKLAVPGASANASGNTLTYVISIWCKNAPRTVHACPLYVANAGL